MKSMNNKGFTLIELIATLVLLMIVMGIGTYSITKIINNSKKKDYELLIKNIKDAAELFYQECKYTKEDTMVCYYDFNGDGKVLSSDLSFLAGCVNGSNPSENCKYALQLGDLNRNGSVDSEDTNKIQAHIFGSNTDGAENNNFTNLDKLITLGFLTGNAKNSDDSSDLVDPRTKKDIRHCIVTFKYVAGKFTVSTDEPENVIDLVTNEMVKNPCPVAADYTKILGE